MPERAIDDASRNACAEALGDAKKDATCAFTARPSLGPGRTTSPSPTRCPITERLT